MSAQENAEAILIVIKRILKWASIVLVGIIIFALGAWGISSVYDWFTHDRYVKMVKVEAKFKSPECDSTWPVLVTVENKSPKTIVYSNIYIDVFKNGHSDYINKPFDSVSSDYIIAPGVTAQVCWAPKSKEYPYKTLDGVNMTAAVESFSLRFKD